MGLSDSLPGRLLGYVFPRCVGRFRSHRAGPPRLLGSSFPARCPQPPRKVRQVLSCCFPSGSRLHPSRRTGHLRVPIEAESGSLALRLTGSPPESAGPITGTRARSATCRTGNSHGELLSVHKIRQAYPGTPEQQSRNQSRTRGFGAVRGIGVKIRYLLLAPFEIR